MDADRRNRLAARARVMKALSHPTRLLIVEELAARERSVLELTAMVKSDVSTVSKHLAVMRNAGVVRDERRGARVFYSLQVSCVVGFFSCVDGIIANEAERQRRAVGQ